MVDVSKLFLNVVPKSVLVKEKQARVPKVTPEALNLAKALIAKAEEIGGQSDPFPWTPDSDWKLVSYAMRKESGEKYILASAGNRNVKAPTIEIDGVRYPLVKIALARHPVRKNKD